MIATRADIPRIVWMAGKFHKQHGAKWPFDPQAAAAFFQSLVDSDDGLLLVTNKGFAAAVANRHPMSPDWLMVSQLLMWSEDGAGARFWRAMRKWADDIGASEFRCSCHPENERVSAFMARQGDADEIIYTRAL